MSHGVQSPNGFTSATNKRGTKELPFEIDGISSKFSSMMAHEFGDSISSTSLGNGAPIT
jgi:hypothetical protein